MKKLISTLLAFVLLVSLVACGGENPKLVEAKDAFNALSTQFNEIAALVNENKDALSSEAIDTLNQLSDMLNQYGEVLTSGNVDDAQLDAILGWFGTAKDGLAVLKEDVETAISAEGVFPAALANLDAYEIPELAGSAWGLAGGMINGVEMEDEDLNAVLEACGGVFMFLFDAPGSVSMYNGETQYTGTYEAVEDNAVLFMEFEGYTYYGVFTMVDDSLVLIIANTEAPDTALYLVPDVG